MKLLTSTEYKQLIENGIGFNFFKDHKPVVRLETSNNSCFWTITAILENGKAYGLTKLCGQEPQLGYILPQQIFEIAKILGTEVVKSNIMKKYPISVHYICANYEHIIQRMEHGF